MRPRPITVAVFLALYAAQGVAAEDGASLEEILVTARRILTPGFGAIGLDAPRLPASAPAPATPPACSRTSPA